MALPLRAKGFLRYAVSASSRACHYAPVLSRSASSASRASSEIASKPYSPRSSVSAASGLAGRDARPLSPALSRVPTSTIVRSLAITSVSGNAALLALALHVLARIVKARSRSPALRWLLKTTLYRQFCAGENVGEVRRTAKSFKGMGYAGVILGFAKEDARGPEEKAAAGQTPLSPTEVSRVWKTGVLDTIALAEKEDFVNVKLSGAGEEALGLLAKSLPPSKALAEALTDICNAAAKRSIRILFDAEQQAIQTGIDAWILYLAERYNRPAQASARIYGTYQAYLKSTPATLTEHLKRARQGGFALGVKLVRGAYLSSDPRHLIHDTKEHTDDAYDALAASLLQRRWPKGFESKEGEGHLPAVDVVIASHNAASVNKAVALQAEQLRAGAPIVHVVFAQLMGMADEVSCGLLDTKLDGKRKPDRAAVYKCMAWGSVDDCLAYLHRRALENRDALARTRAGRDALAGELWRRIIGAKGSRLEL
ncbi:MAG: proline dehydrogenase [Trizodia sp. TS-e1964]|nr:MAG: proline dehydrogenase [Trizodia sp. TS-e1964]